MTLVTAPCAVPGAAFNPLHVSILPILNQQQGCGAGVQDTCSNLRSTAASWTSSARCLQTVFADTIQCLCPLDGADVQVLTLCSHVTASVIADSSMAATHAYTRAFIAGSRSAASTHVAVVTGSLRQGGGKGSAYQVLPGGKDDGLPSATGW